ncbi:MAG: RodZ domain-containing protein [Pseudomonadota bacterium]
MIGRWGQSDPQDEAVQLKGFDDFELRLGDIMRGERATLGKSLLDVQRELKIKAAYIAAIENADPSAFDTPGFIAGFVRSYARYLGMDPEIAFERFCEESGFATAHGMSQEALPLRKSREDRVIGRPASEALAAPSVPFQPVEMSALTQVEPRAIGSIFVLLALIGGLGYGAWAVLQEIQRVELAPIDQAPVVASNVAPLGAGSGFGATAAMETAGGEALPAPSTDALERLYRPAALDVPVLVARDAPIASLNPDNRGVFASGPSETLPNIDGAAVQVVDGQTPEVTLIAVEPTWVRIQTPGNTVILEQLLDAGSEYAIPVTEETPVLRAGDAGAIYFRVNGTVVGPAGPAASSISDLLLASTDLSAAYPPANPLEDRALFELLTELGSPDVLPKPAAALVPVVTDERVALVSVADSWVRVRDAEGDVRVEGIIAPGDVRLLPEDVTAGSMRAGNSGSLFFRVGSLYFGPVGEGGVTAINVDVSADAIRAEYPAVSAADWGLPAPEVD